MYLFSYDRTECCGCSACQQICPVNCIKMVVHNDGFFYPEIDLEACIQCNKCVNVCPFHRSKKSFQGNSILVCYYGWHLDEITRMNSTSGGAFSAIAESILETSNSRVYGACYNDTWRVCHKGTNSGNGLEALRQSKYIQSDLENTYAEIRDYLNLDGHVLFCGTPCQVDGLRCYLGKDYEKLLLLEFICHGVTSPAIFKSYIRSLEKQYGAPVKTFRFRDKVTIGNLLSLGHTTITFENGKKWSSECNLYLRAYMAGLMQRASCEKCPYATPQRRADITVGDFWGLEDILPELKNQSRKGISLILGNTPKGRAICRNLSEKMHLVQTEIAHAFNGINKQLEKPVQSNKNKLRLYGDIDKLGIQLALARAIGIKSLLEIYYGWFINRIKAYLPVKIYRTMVLIKRTIHR